MSEAGLTHGGFYAHFGSKDALMAESIAAMFGDARRRTSQLDDALAGPDLELREAILRYRRSYLSTDHRDLPERGCPLPSLSADVARKGAATAGSADPGLVALLVTARRWWDRLATGEIDITTFAREEGVNDSWMSRVIRMNFLSPRIIEAILTVTQPVNLTARSLRRQDIPLDWDEQWDLLAG